MKKAGVDIWIRAYRSILLFSPTIEKVRAATQIELLPVVLVLAKTRLTTNAIRTITEPMTIK